MGYKYLLVVIDDFSKLVWTNALKNNIAQTITNSSENILSSSKGRPNLNESDCGSEFFY